MHFVTLALFAPSLVMASGMNDATASHCLRDRLLGQIKTIQTRPAQVDSRYRQLQKACSERRFNICKDATLSDEQRKSLLRAASHLDKENIRNAFLQSFPPRNKSDLEKLNRYLAKRLEFCDPPIHQTCASDRWQLVIEDYVARHGTIAKAKYLSRWNEDNLMSRIPGLEDFLNERKGLAGFRQNPEAYQKLLQTPGLSADSISIVSEQAMKKRINDVNKGFSDALGETRMRSFHWYLEKALAEEGITLPDAVRVDFKTDRLIEPLLKLHQDHPRKIEQAVNRAAAEANAEMTLAVQTRFPELMYITDMYEPNRWFNTATFSRPGYSPRLNEALASFKARKMREVSALSDVEARDQFVALAKNAIAMADEMKKLDAQSDGKLLKAGVIDKYGAFTQKTAEIIRKRKPEASLSSAIVETFKVRPTKAQEKLLEQQWHSQDMLSLPLVTIDKMPDIPKKGAILGGDGIAGGAIDAWTKMQALLAHRDLILSKVSSDELVKFVFNALVEADANASAIIRSAPMLLKNAVEMLSPSELKKSGMTQFFSSADDAIVPFDRLMERPSQQRSFFYHQLTWNISGLSRTVQVSLKGVVSDTAVGPGILRAFLGHDKSSAEAAEQFLKPIEERLASAKILGPNWRDQYPKVALLAVQEKNQTIKLIVAGKDIDESFKNKFKQALRATLRTPEQVDLQFVPSAP